MYYRPQPSQFPKNNQSATFAMESAYIKFSRRDDSLSCKMIMENDVTILFSDYVSDCIVPLQTLNLKYYKYAIIKNGLKLLV